jgi:curli production assembly/transport component CsgG
MRKSGWSSGAVGAILLMTTAASVCAVGPQRPFPPIGLKPVETSFEVSGRFTAQRRPRVTVLHFQDTNTEAEHAHYGSSVEAMLVTFLKRKSQFVVVERQRLKDVLEEKQRIQRGQIHLNPDDPTSRELLEKIDVFILGSVTLLDVEDDVKVAGKSVVSAAGGEAGSGSLDDSQTAEEVRPEIRGPRIEVDAKLLSRFDGRIVAAAQRRGPVACLRSIVERLGIALEQDFLRPYYGRLRVKLTEPEYARFILTPILLDSALDEEKPPVERATTVRIGAEQDNVQSWTTDPTTYTIENLLSGWYTMRLERSGYNEIKSDPARWEARDRFGKIELYDRVTETPFAKVSPELRRFVVHVDPLGSDLINGDTLDFVFHKNGGSLAPRIRRQYVDADFTHSPQRIMLVGKKLDINEMEGPAEYAEDSKCDLFQEEKPVPPHYGKTYVASGQTFDFDSFKGGKLVIEDYQGEVIPTGVYRMALWEPYFETEKFDVRVYPQDNKKVAQTVLNRSTEHLVLGVTGPRPASRMALEGRDTHQRVALPLDFSGDKEQPKLPVDVYSASTNISGLDGWRQNADLLPAVASPALTDVMNTKEELRLIYEPEELPAELKRLESEKEKKKSAPPAEPHRLTVKTRFGVAGHLDVFSKTPDPLAADYYLDKDVLEILDLLIYGHEAPPEEPPGFWKTLFGGRRSAARKGLHTLPAAGFVPPSPPPKVEQAAAWPQVAAELLARSDGPSFFVESGPVASSSPNGDKTERRVSYPRDPDKLRELLAHRLEMIDLLVLSGQDMAELRRSPEVSAIIQRYIAAGGSLFAFVDQAGDYGDAVGASLSVELPRRRTRRFEVAQGAVSGIVPKLDKKRLKVKSKRALPELADDSSGSWRVIANSQRRKGPRIIERGSRTEGGYVALWLDNPESFRGPLGGTVAKVEETRARLEEHVWEWAHFLMYRRFDQTGEQRRRAEAEITR